MGLFSLIRNYKNVKNANIEFIKVVSRPKSKKVSYDGYENNYKLVFKLNEDVIFNSMDMSKYEIGIRDINFINLPIGFHDDIIRLEYCNLVKEKLSKNNFFTKYKVMKMSYDILKKDIESNRIKDRMKELIDGIPVEEE